MDYFLILTLLSYFATTYSAEPSSVTYLEAEEIVNYSPRTNRVGFLQNELRIYCFHGAEKTIPRLFESVELLLDIAEDDYTQYEGITPAEVHKHYDEQRSLFSFNIFSQKRPRLQISPFGQHCIGIETTQAYRVKLHQIRVDFWRVIQLIVGILVFIYAGQLSNNSVFFYMAGITIGICSSFMLLIWLASKLVPKRPVMYGVLIGGWTIGIYMIQLLWENIQVIVLTYRSYVFWYIFTTGLISFLLCYRWGPPRNRRSKNIIKWTLQFVALIFIYLSSYFEEATVAIIVLTAILHYFPNSLLTKMRAFYLKRFPPKRRFLTNEEYYEEGVKETTKALDELRKFASSPECKQWRLMSKLKDPMRFGAFVEGASHLRDEEILHFENADVANYDDSEAETEENEQDAVEEEISEEDEESNVERYANHTRRTANRVFSNSSPNTRYSNIQSRSEYSTEYSRPSLSQQRYNREVITNNTASSNFVRQNRYSRQYSNSDED